MCVLCLLLYLQNIYIHIGITSENTSKEEYIALIKAIIDAGLKKQDRYLEKKHEWLQNVVDGPFCIPELIELLLPFADIDRKYYNGNESLTILQSAIRR